MRARTIALAAALGAALAGGFARAAEGPALPKIDWSFERVLGTFDPAARQRGFQVYQNVCSACHALGLLHYRDLAEIGYDAEQVKAFAAATEADDGPNDEGEMFKRPGRAADKLKKPFKNEQAARAANNGALPPDLSLLYKARANGANYIYGVLTGYADAPAGMSMMSGMNYNKFFPGNQIAMPQPLSDGSVNYADGTKATLDQQARDVVTFLAWAAEPNLEARKAMGVKVLLFLLALTALLYAVKRKVWAKLH